MPGSRVAKEPYSLDVVSVCQDFSTGGHGREMLSGQLVPKNTDKSLEVICMPPFKTVLVT